MGLVVVERRTARRRFRFRPDPPPPPRPIEDIIRDLVIAAKRVNEAKDALRLAAEDVAGTALSDWSIQDIMNWVDGMLFVWVGPQVD